MRPRPCSRRLAPPGRSGGWARRPPARRGPAGRSPRSRAPRLRRPRPACDRTCPCAPGRSAAPRRRRGAGLSRAPAWPPAPGTARPCSDASSPGCRCSAAGPSPPARLCAPRWCRRRPRGRRSRDPRLRACSRAGPRRAARRGRRRHRWRGCRPRLARRECSRSAAGRTARRRPDWRARGDVGA